ncbi:ATP-dependent DNA helicase srs2 [Neonectria punicea]|uniref:ATP-dependent DNA helicase srs2 n=1 Tax=Neonectria punicea TaxID=979145 RepID=A0ABR1GRD4_9HYPO
MSPTLLGRIASPAAQVARHANFSTAKPLLKPLLATAGSAPTATTTSGFSKWRWTSLSPKARRNVVLGLGVGTCVDTVVLYNYWPRIFGTK